jgi:hypothetical protein
MESGNRIIMETGEKKELERYGTNFSSTMIFY